MVTMGLEGSQAEQSLESLGSNAMVAKLLRFSILSCSVV
jgi:hypothetical protein